MRCNKAPQQLEQGMTNVSLAAPVCAGVIAYNFRANLPAGER